MIVVGIDPGQSCGVAAVGESWVAWTTVTLPGWRQYASLVEAVKGRDAAIYDALLGLSDLMGIDMHRQIAAIVVEDSQHARSLRHAAAAGWALGEVGRVAAWLGAPAVPVAPSRWQHGLVGAQGRPAYVAHAQALTGGVLPASDHDAAAAICLAEWGWQQREEGAL